MRISTKPGVDLTPCAVAKVFRGKDSKKESPGKKAEEGKIQSSGPLQPVALAAKMAVSCGFGRDRIRCAGRGFLFGYKSANHPLHPVRIPTVGGR